MDLRQLRYILTIAQTGNITKAAEELFMTQPALSHFISKIEKEEGVQLFDRTVTPVKLTYAGEKYVETIKKILDLNDQLETSMAEITGHIAGRLIIGIPPARATSLLPKIIPDFTARFPKVEIQTVEHNTRQLKEDLQKERIDFAVLPLLSGMEEFRNIPLFKEELFLITKAGSLPKEYYFHNKQGQKVVYVNKLSDQKFILLKKGHGARDAIDLLFNLNHLKPDIFLETTNNETAFMLAAVGCGVAIVPEYNIDTLKPLSDIDIFKISETGMTWDITALLPAFKKENLIVNECIKLISEKYGDNYAE